MKKKQKQIKDKMHMEVLRLREYEEAFHLLFESYGAFDQKKKEEICNGLNSIFRLNDWERIR